MKFQKITLFENSNGYKKFKLYRNFCKKYSKFKRPFSIIFEDFEFSHENYNRESNFPVRQLSKIRYFSNLFLESSSSKYKSFDFIENVIGT